ncbi:MAG: hypothetical protein NZ935_01700, partial [Planctomycetes bacterium]|nr:hypothetical protein [Planctomycetota bacterium]
MSKDTCRTSTPKRLLIRLWVILAVFGLAAPGVEAANGDLAAVSDTLSLSNRELIDMAEDSRDGTFWILGANGSSVENHLIYHLSRDLNTVIETVENPHPSGSIS